MRIAHVLALVVSASSCKPQEPVPTTSATASASSAPSTLTTTRPKGPLSAGVICEQLRVVTSAPRCRQGTDGGFAIVFREEPPNFALIHCEAGTADLSPAEAYEGMVGGMLKRGDTVIGSPTAFCWADFDKSMKPAADLDAKVRAFFEAL